MSRSDWYTACTCERRSALCFNVLHGTLQIERARDLERSGLSWLETSRRLSAPGRSPSNTGDAKHDIAADC